jgi:hypothetical protein
LDFPINLPFARYEQTKDWVPWNGDGFKIEWHNVVEFDEAVLMAERRRTVA